MAEKEVADVVTIFDMKMGRVSTRGTYDRGWTNDTHCGGSHAGICIKGLAQHQKLLTNNFNIEKYRDRTVTNVTFT